jgi:hypothetical protein
MKHHKSMIGPIFLVIGLLVYYSLAIIAIVNYSGGFDIYNDLWTHLRWFEYNSGGALFFRIGNVIYALTLIIFFLSVSGWIAAVAERRFLIYLIQVIGISIAVLMIIGEILADQSIVFVIASGTSLLLTVIILIGIPILLYSHPEFWKVSILLFIISIALSSYLLYMGIIDAPIREFRIIDFLATAFNQVSIFIIAFNIAKMETH